MVPEENERKSREKVFDMAARRKMETRETSNRVLNLKECCR